MEFIHISKKEIRIFVGSAEREKRLRDILKKYFDVIKAIQAELK